MLRAEGFVQLEQRRGFVVSPLDSTDIRDLFAGQALLAGELAARTARRASKDDIKVLLDLQYGLERAAERNDVDQLQELNFRFHRAVNLLAAAPKITWLIGVAVRCVPYRFYSTIDGWPASTVEDHREVLAALASGSAAKARTSMTNHIVKAGYLLAAYFERSVAEPTGIDGAMPESRTRPGNFP